MNLHDFMAHLAANSWRAGILILIVFALRGLMRRWIDARVLYWVWIVVAARLLLPFDLPAPVAARYMPATPWVYVAEVQMPPPVTPAAHPLRDFLLNEKTAAAVWLFGVAAVLLRHFGANLSLRRRLARDSRCAGKRTEEMVADCAWRMGLNPIAAFEADHIPGPALFGIWRPLLLFPKGLAEKLSDGELRLVVLHEMGHLKRRDLPLQCLLVFAQAVHWFNPLAWLAVRLARADRELACDEFVMVRTSEAGADAYAKTLLRVLSLSRPGRLTLPAVGIIETKNKLKQRIIMIQNYKTTNLPRQILGAVSILAVSAGLLTASAQNSTSVSPTTTEVSAETANEQAKASKIIIPKVEFRDATVEEAVNWLRAKSRELDPEKKGVEIILGAGTEKIKEARITLSLTDIPVNEFVKYIAEAANMEMIWVGKVIVIRSKPAGVTSGATTGSSTR